MEKQKLTNAGKEAYWNLFVNRSDVYLKQDSMGEPRKVSSPLTTDILFDANENIGTYQLNTENQVIYAVLDIDLVKDIHGRNDFTLNDWLPVLQKQVITAREILIKANASAYVEFSGYKGYHLWVFFNRPMPAGAVRRWMHSLFDNMPKANGAIEWEIFPKQDKVEPGKYGNYVKSPMQIHKKSGKFSYFVDDDFKEIDLDLTSINKIDLPETNDVTAKHCTGKLSADKIDVIINKCRWIRETIEKARKDKLSGSIGHEDRLALASILHPFGENGYNRLIEIISHCSDYDPDVTRKHWESIDKPPHTCNRICTGNICDEMRSAGGTSPIKFAYDDVRKPVAFHEEDQCYYKNKKQISTFIVKPLELLVLPESDCLIADVYSNAGYHYKDVKLENTDWHNRQKFLKAIGHQDCTFTGSENDLQELCSYVNAMTPVRKTGTDVIGLINDTWVTKDINITKNGIVEPMKIVPYEKGADAYYHKIKYNIIPPAEYDAFRKDFYRYIVNINEPNVIYPTIAWFFASVLKTKLQKKLDGFPLLFIHGGQGSGKSTTGSIFMRIAGYSDASPNSCTMRPFPLLKLLSSNNGIPVILDEFKMGDMRNDNVDNLFRYMRSSYKGEVEQKGRADQTVDEYRLSAPMALMGEWSITMPALRERFILVRFSDIIKKSQSMQSAYDELKSLPLEGFMPPFIEFCLKQDIDSLIKRANDIISLHKVAPRIHNNIATMVIGLLLFEGFGDAGKIDYDSLITAQINNITGNDTGYVKSAVDQLIEELEVMAMNEELIEGKDYRIIDNDKRIAIAFNYLYPRFRLYADRTKYEGEILDKQSYKAMFRECDYVITESRVTKFNDVGKRCVIVDVKKAKKKGITFDGFIK